jgi:hypothetical protein
MHRLYEIWRVWPGYYMILYWISVNFFTIHRKVVEQQVVEQEVDSGKKLQLYFVWIGMLWHTTTMHILHAEIEYSCYVCEQNWREVKKDFIYAYESFLFLIHNSGLHLKFVPHDMSAYTTHLVLSYILIGYLAHIWLYRKIIKCKFVPLKNFTVEKVKNLKIWIYWSSSLAFKTFST